MGSELDLDLDLLLMNQVQMDHVEQMVEYLMLLMVV
jgi:hypothetical protein